MQGEMAWLVGWVGGCLIVYLVCSFVYKLTTRPAHSHTRVLTTPTDIHTHQHTHQHTHTNTHTHTHTHTHTRARAAHSRQDKTESIPRKRSKTPRTHTPTHPQRPGRPAGRPGVPQRRAPPPHLLLRHRTSEWVRGWGGGVPPCLYLVDRSIFISCRSVAVPSHVCVCVSVPCLFHSFIYMFILFIMSGLVPHVCVYVCMCLLIHFVYL